MPNFTSQGSPKVCSR